MDKPNRSVSFNLNKSQRRDTSFSQAPSISSSHSETQIHSSHYPRDYTDEVKAKTARLYEGVKHVIPAFEWPALAPLIFAINKLKSERNALILAHNYMTPEIFCCVGDYTGDSLGLARKASEANADIIIQAGVHFMAETSKILCPEKTVLIPHLKAGCSLASSITGEDVKSIRKNHPGLPIVTYVNTSADVKAESDICCTSSNAVQVVESLGSDHVIMIPDEYLARNVAAQTSVKITSWKGRCEVHERFDREDIIALRDAHPKAKVIAHPECSPDVTQQADFTGSTAAMSDYVKTFQPTQVVMVTECSMSDNVAAENPNVDFIRPCNLCPHMKRITLENIYDALRFHQYEVKVDDKIAEKAKRAVERMLALPTPEKPAKFDPVEQYPEIGLID